MFPIGTSVNSVNDDQMLVASIIIPTHGRRDSLCRVLKALAYQHMPERRFDVVVVCDGDVDGSAIACRVLACELPFQLHIVEQVNQGPAAARNRGVAEARAPLIIFLDDDVIPGEGFIATHLAAQDGQTYRITIGPLLPPPDHLMSPWSNWEARTLCRQYDAMIAGHFEPTYRQFYTGNASLLRHHLLECGGFDATYRRAEDVELALRLHSRGLHFVFLPEARGWHYVQRSFRSWLGISAAYGAADCAMARADRHWILELVAREFQHRHAVVRGLTQIVAGRPFLMKSITALFSRVILLTSMTGATRVGTLACSIVFNVCYYDGLAAALGGREAFLGLLQEQRVA